MPSAGEDYYLGRLATQNGGASHRSREPRSSGFVVRTAETGGGGAARTGLKNPTKIRVYDRAAGGAKPVSKKV